MFYFGFLYNKHQPYCLMRFMKAEKIDYKSSGTKRKRNPAFDFLKGIAIILILSHHAMFGQDFFNQDIHLKLNEELYFQLFAIKSWLYVFFWYVWVYLGKFGNTLFIGITAFLLTFPNSSFHKSQSYILWLAKKLKRIYLLYLLLIPLSLVLYTTLQGIFISSSELLTTLIGIQPYFGYWAGSLNGAWWFISTIVSLYVLFPPLYKIFKKIGSLKFLFLAVVLNIITWYYSVQFADQLPRNFSEFFLFNHLLTIALGMSLASHLKAFENKKIYVLVPFFIFILFLLAQWADQLGFPELTFEFLFSRNILFLVLFTIAFYFRKQFIKVIPILWLGKYTYPIFLSNLLVFNTLSFVLEWNLLFVGLFLTISCAIGWSLQKAIDILDRKIRTLKQWVLYTFIIAILSFILFKYNYIVDIILSTPLYHLGIDVLLLYLILLLFKNKREY